MLHLRSFNRFFLISLALLGLSVSSANASLFVMDSTNGYQVTLESGATISHIAGGGGRHIVLTGMEFAFGDFSTASFPTGITTIGNIGPMPRILVVNALTFTLRVESTQNLWDGTLLYWGGCDRGGCGATPTGTRPSPDNLASAVFELTQHVASPSPVPVPAAVWLFGSALIGLVGFSKRKDRIAA